MSYILGALRKAEQERKQESALDTADWDSAEWSKLESRQATSPILKIALIVIILLLIAILLLVGRLLIRPAGVEQPAVLHSSIDHAEASIGTSESEAVISSTNTVTSPLEEEAAATSAQLTNIVDSSVGQAQPDLPTITGHLYFPGNDSLSRIFTDSGSFRVGHVFDDGLTLTSITENLAVFESQDQRYEISLENQY